MSNLFLIFLLFSSQVIISFVFRLSEVGTFHLNEAGGVLKRHSLSQQTCSALIQRVLPPLLKGVTVTARSSSVKREMEFKKKIAVHMEELIQLVYQTTAVIHCSAGIGFS